MEDMVRSKINTAWSHLHLFVCTKHTSTLTDSQGDTVKISRMGSNTNSK